MSQTQPPAKALAPPNLMSSTAVPQQAVHQHLQRPQAATSRMSPAPQHSPTHSPATTSFANSSHAAPGSRTPNGFLSPTTTQSLYPQQQQQQQPPSSHQQHQVNQNGASNVLLNSQGNLQAPRLNTANGVPDGFKTPGQPVTSPSSFNNGANQPSQSSYPPVTSPSHTYSNATFAPTASHLNPGTPAYSVSSAMPPPPVATAGMNDSMRQSSFALAQKPVAPVKTYAYDMDDTLAGTGINLEEEEQYIHDFETRTGFAALPPGGRGSFYGAGPASQPSEQFQAKSTEELAAETADRAWTEAATRLAVSRTRDHLEHGFIHPGMLHARMNKIATDNSLILNLDPKPPNPGMPLGRFSHPNTWEKPEIRVMTRTSPNGTIVSTQGSFIPKDAYLIDQIALLSLATKERLRELLGDANRVACHRQETAHGSIPSEWVDAAESYASMGNSTSPRTNPLKRPANEMSNGLPTPVSEAPPTNPLTDTLVNLSKKTQSLEEARLKKRQKRMEQAAEKEKNPNGANVSRGGSVVPGTPGSAAPEQPDKPITKKESKKAAKLAEQTNSVTVNSTVNQFMGRNKKKYSWLSGGAAPGSGANTPKGTTGTGTPTIASGGRAATGPLTQDSSHHLGQLREDEAKGKNIQMRDWIAALEQNGALADKRTLQYAYKRLDRSDWGDKAVVPKAAPPSPAVKTAASSTAAPTPLAATPNAPSPAPAPSNAPTPGAAISSTPTPTNTTPVPTPAPPPPVPTQQASQV